MQLWAAWVRGCAGGGSRDLRAGNPDLRAGSRDLRAGSRDLRVGSRDLRAESDELYWNAIKTNKNIATVRIVAWPVRDKILWVRDNYFQGATM